MPPGEGSGSVGNAAEMERIAAGYLDFAEQEADPRSPLYADFARGVASDAAVLELLAGWPRGTRQPNLVFAAVRYLADLPASYPDLRERLLGDSDRVLAVARSHRTQTNEPARCAMLLPLLAALPQPLALVEIGASAGLCLLPDRYAYDYDGRRIGTSSLVLPCAVRGPMPTVTRLPRIAWRAGLDLDPVDLADADRVRWLRALIWPGQEERLNRLDAAIEIAAADPPPIQRGDLRTDLAGLLEAAPRPATLVVFHTAVLAYVPAADRPAVAETIRASGATWLSNEGPGVLADVFGPPPARRPRGAFLLCQDGRAQAWTDPHGAWLRWLDGGPRPPA